jgi:uncharacterized protein (TIGR03382 family)
MLAVVVAVALVPRAARAFPTGLQFDNDPLNLNMRGDGGGGVAFTGAPRFAGHTCAVCHTDAPGRIGLRIESDHPEMFTDGWKAGQVYHLRVILTGEWAGVQYKTNGDACGDTSATPYLPCDTNGFALEMDDPQGQVVGKLAPLVNGGCTGAQPTGAEDAYILTDGSAAIESGAHHAQTAWDLCWTAPGPGASTITAYLTAVDGNGGDGTASFPNDPVGDDVASGQVAFPELGAPVLTTQTGGCDAGGGDVGVAVAIAIAALVSMRRRRALAAVVLAAIGLGLGGCAHVRPHQRETLAARKMKFSPDPTEDELDLHMQESREGSAGGYGSAGGGCGCN